MVFLAMGADQPANALRCQSLGVGANLDPLEATPADVRDAVESVLGNPVYRQAASELQDEISTLPEPATTVPLLERLAGRVR
jgi:UDP:flavonoid glycosyltransferase YjiC (YdhE family)